VRVFADRLLAGTMTAQQVPASLCIVVALGEENRLRIEKLMGADGRQPIYKALLACPPARLREIAAWRYLVRGIRLIGVGEVGSIELDAVAAIADLVERYARRYDRVFQ
jgi:hypothetical protein